MPSIQEPDRKLRVKAAPGKRKEQIERSFLIDYCRNKAEFSWLLAPVSEIKEITIIRETVCGLAVTVGILHMASCK